MNWINGMRIWHAVRGEGSELGNSSPRGTPLARGEGSELGIWPGPKSSPCWGENGLEVRSWGGGGILEDDEIMEVKLLDYL